MAYYQRSFTAETAWQTKQVLLQLDGVDGLAEVYVNDQRVGWLGAWEPEWFDVRRSCATAPRTRSRSCCARGAERNMRASMATWACASSQGPMLHDVTVRPLVDKGQIEISATVWNPGQAIDGHIALEVRAKSDPSK